MVRIERNENGDWIVMDSGDKYHTLTYRFEDLPSPMKEKLALLFTAPVGYRDERIGRKVSDAVYWIFDHKVYLHAH